MTNTLNRTTVSSQSFALCTSLRGTLADASELLQDVTFTDAELVSVGIDRRTVERIRQQVSQLNKLVLQAKK